MVAVRGNQTGVLTLAQAFSRPSAVATGRRGSQSMAPAAGLAAMARPPWPTPRRRPGPRPRRKLRSVPRALSSFWARGRLPLLHRCVERSGGTRSVALGLGPLVQRRFCTATHGLTSIGRGSHSAVYANLSRSRGAARCGWPNLVGGGLAGSCIWCWHSDLLPDFFAELFLGTRFVDAPAGGSPLSC